eukprot:1137965-Lingulodinium_polyedra.AAC.1
MKRASVRRASRCVGETLIRPRHCVCETLRNAAVESTFRRYGGSQTARPARTGFRPAPLRRQNVDSTASL